MTRIPSAVTDQGFYFFAADETDLTTPETGLASFTVYRSRNGAAETAMTTPTITEIDATNMPGVYFLLCDEDMTIDAGDDEQEMAYRITHSGMHPVTKVIELYRAKITAGNTLGVESDGDLTKVNTLDGHTAQSGDSYARLGAPAGASVSADIATIVDGVLDGIRIRKNTEFVAFPFKMVAATDHVTASTGLTVTATRSIDGGAFAACTNSAAEIASGWYKITLAAADLNGDVIILRFTATGADDREIVVFTQPAD